LYTFFPVSIQRSARNVRNTTNTPDGSTVFILAFWPLRQLYLLRTLRALRRMETTLVKD